MAQELIFERYKYPLFAGSIENATHFADGINPVCGDEVHVELKVEGETIQEIKHSCRACAICTASADLLAEELTGKSTVELLNFESEKATELVVIPLSPIRIKCALLPLETLKLALEQA